MKNGKPYIKKSEAADSRRTRRERKDFNDSEDWEREDEEDPMAEDRNEWDR